MPRSCPPPCICASMRTRGLLRRTNNAPTPFGPYILCADMLASGALVDLTPDLLAGVEKLSDEDLISLEKQFERVRKKAERDGNHPSRIKASEPR